MATERSLPNRREGAASRSRCYAGRRSPWHGLVLILGLLAVSACTEPHGDLRRGTERPDAPYQTPQVRRASAGPTSTPSAKAATGFSPKPTRAVRPTKAVSPSSTPRIALPSQSAATSPVLPDGERGRVYLSAKRGDVNMLWVFHSQSRKPIERSILKPEEWLFGVARREREFFVYSPGTVRVLNADSFPTCRPDRKATSATSRLSSES